MKMRSPNRFGVALLMLACPAGAAHIAAAQTLPPSQPTALAAAPGAGSPRPLQQPPASPHRARVEVNAGLVSVTADDSSLNQILREISLATGMKITGGVTEERVYGNYGPADSSAVLSALLKGTGSNMMLVLDGQNAPRELVLTPRNGGPTPPNPSAAGADLQDLPPQGIQRMPNGIGGFQPPPQPQPIQPIQPVAQPQPSQFPPVPTGFGASTPPTPPPADTTTQQSPNGVQTPQQVYDQLMKLQQQQRKVPQP